MSYSFIIPGKPRPKERPRIRRDGRSYTAPRTAEAERLIKHTYLGPKFQGPVRVELTFYPEHTRVDIREVAAASAQRADLDNLVKLVLDGLNGVAFEDDRQVVFLKAEKL